MIFVIVALVVGILDLSGLALDERLQRLLYVEEEDLEVKNDAAEQEEKIDSEVFNATNSKASKDDVLEAISSIYGKE